MIDVDLMILFIGVFFKDLVFFLVNFVFCFNNFLENLIVKCY